ncbi:putative membrane protein [Wickerhamomyces ciferrii]|uniref:Membrane protein n=1 Tax=Wickerhamomyces ciferrii (strain ATCC 14091 / BCRC 22168 / CBS 111 / JCM 3599 / NBRC 0793 / NRRL Y-1031 F-60-10) TaxID=1206466 RepID=K0KYJ7_WICCF|nr:uncharacterized protein BN7_6097 [Wickerhamomyces ciferrii]CCH46504.1 putative membrane protein [Wickerhamomyces ciferrii]
MSQALAPDTKSIPPNTGVKTKKVLRRKQQPPKPIKKYVWLGGHVSTLLFGSIYLAFYFARYILWKTNWYWTPRIAYRLSFIGVIASYSITVLTTFGSIIPNYYTLLATENFQSLMLGFVWLLSRPSAFKLVPFFIISILQLSSQYNVSAVLKNQNSLVDIITISEVAVFVAILFDTLIFRGTSGYALVIYLGFYWLRINFSPYTQAFLLKLIRTIDEKIIAKQKPEVQEKWQKIKDFVEFRRQQTRKAISKGLDREPAVKASNRNPDANKPVGKSENYQLKGQSVPDSSETKKLATEGVKVPTVESQVEKTNFLEKADKGEAPIKVQDPQKAYDENFKAGVLASTSAAGTGFAAGAASEGAKAGRKQNEHPTSKVPAQEQPRDHLSAPQGFATGSSAASTRSSSSYGGSATRVPPPQQQQQVPQGQQQQQFQQQPVQPVSNAGQGGVGPSAYGAQQVPGQGQGQYNSNPNVAPASGRIQPGSAASPVQRQQGFQQSPLQQQQGFANQSSPSPAQRKLQQQQQQQFSTDQAKLNLQQRAQQVERHAQQARSNLTEIQRRTQAGIATSQGHGHSSGQAFPANQQ